MNAFKRLRLEYNLLQATREKTSIGNHGGETTDELSDRTVAKWREDQNRCSRDIEHRQEAKQSRIDEGARIFGPARNAQDLFVRQLTPENSRFLNFAPTNLFWENEEVVETARQLFVSSRNDWAVFPHGFRQRWMYVGRMIRSGAVVLIEPPVDEDLTVSSW